MPARRSGGDIRRLRNCLGPCAPRMSNAPCEPAGNPAQAERAMATGNVIFFFMHSTALVPGMDSGNHLLRNVLRAILGMQG